MFVVHAAILTIPSLPPGAGQAMRRPRKRSWRRRRRRRDRRRWCKGSVPRFRHMSIMALSCIWSRQLVLVRSIPFFLVFFPPIPLSRFLLECLEPAIPLPTSRNPIYSTSCPISVFEIILHSPSSPLSFPSFPPFPPSTHLTPVLSLFSFLLFPHGFNQIEKMIAQDNLSKKSEPDMLDLVGIGMLTVCV